ncbi:HalOD1 output domain-containing protein [Natrialba sp. SSL1]|uniref:HalOD1 output domain-containing protein n=1 Tax=Natrialba sp. SSL1 TaxID=1869245 RepID=UPI001495BB32
MGTTEVGTTSHPLLIDIVTRVGEHENCDILDLPPVGKTVDPEALAQVADTPAVTIELNYYGYTLTITDGKVTDCRQLPTAEAVGLSVDSRSADT